MLVFPFSFFIDADTVEVDDQIKVAVTMPSSDDTPIHHIPNSNSSLPEVTYELVDGREASAGLGLDNEHKPPAFDTFALELPMMNVSHQQESNKKSKKAKNNVSLSLCAHLSL